MGDAPRSTASTLAPLLLRQLLRMPPRVAAFPAPRRTHNPLLPLERAFALRTRRPLHRPNAATLRGGLLEHRLPVRRVVRARPRALRLRVRRVPRPITGFVAALRRRVGRAICDRWPTPPALARLPGCSRRLPPPAELAQAHMDSRAPPRVPLLPLPGNRQDPRE